MFIWIFVHLRNPINVRQIELLTIWLYSEGGEDRFVVVQHLWCRKIRQIVCRVSRKWMESKFLDQDVDVVSLANKGIVIGRFVGRNYNKILMETGKLTDNIRVTKNGLGSLSIEKLSIEKCDIRDCSATDRGVGLGRGRGVRVFKNSQNYHRNQKLCQNWVLMAIFITIYHLLSPKSNLLKLATSRGFSLIRPSVCIYCHFHFDETCTVAWNTKRKFLNHYKGNWYD